MLGPTILECIGKYWNTFGVPVLPENEIFNMFSRKC